LFSLLLYFKFAIYLTTHEIQHDKALFTQWWNYFHGKSIGISGTTFGEVCFNTGMTGYQEILPDPSYFGQMVATNLILVTMVSMIKM
jgi:carbamoylphosphate synthase small subunit